MPSSSVVPFVDVVPSPRALLYKLNFVLLFRLLLGFSARVQSILPSATAKESSSNTTPSTILERDEEADCAAAAADVRTEMKLFSTLLGGGGGGVPANS